MDIREKRGFAYDAHTETDVMKDGGTVLAVTQVRNEVVESAMDALNQNMQAMIDRDVQPLESSEAKASYAGHFILALERQSGRADQLATIEVMNLPSDFLDTFMSHIRSVEPDNVRSVSKKYWNPSDATTVVVGDASKTENALEKFGELKVTKPQQ
jgi:zinc protease